MRRNVEEKDEEDEEQDEQDKYAMNEFREFCGCDLCEVGKMTDSPYIYMQCHNGWKTHNDSSLKHALVHGKRKHLIGTAHLLDTCLFTLSEGGHNFLCGKMKRLVK